MKVIGEMWVKDGNEIWDLNTMPLGKPLVLMGGSTVVAKEHRKTQQREKRAFGRFYNRWEIWGVELGPVHNFSPPGV